MNHAKKSKLLGKARKNKKIKKIQSPDSKSHLKRTSVEPAENKDREKESERIKQSITRRERKTTVQKP